MNKNLTIENMNRELLRLMTENPDFKYSDKENYPKQQHDCHYFRGKLNGPACDGCIFGQALQALGVEKVGFEEEGYEGTIDGVWRELTGEVAPEYWYHIQFHQDEGKSWGDLKHLLLNK